ncbi:hypothetical protein C8Q75DRAFT_812252 [Abortiporus biennis]|nr:hypothetical protein C8Q75DRAFT_812252 [Abortiporus biennis]
MASSDPDSLSHFLPSETPLLFSLPLPQQPLLPLPAPTPPEPSALLPSSLLLPAPASLPASAASLLPPDTAPPTTLHAAAAACTLTLAALEAVLQLLTFLRPSAHYPNPSDPNSSTSVQIRLPDSSYPQLPPSLSPSPPLSIPTSPTLT